MATLMFSVAVSIALATNQTKTSPIPAAAHKAARVKIAEPSKTRFSSRNLRPHKAKGNCRGREGKQENEQTNWYLFVVTCDLAVAAFLRWIFIAIQTRHIATSTRVAERALTEIERPWIFVHLERGAFEDKTPGFEKSAYVRFDIANYGKAPAVITKCSVGAGAMIRPETVLRDDLHDVIPPEGKMPARHGFSGTLPFVTFADLFDTEKLFTMPYAEPDQQ